MKLPPSLLCTPHPWQVLSVSTKRLRKSTEIYRSQKEMLHGQKIKMFFFLNWRQMSNNLDKGLLNVYSTLTSYYENCVYFPCSYYGNLNFCKVFLSDLSIDQSCEVYQSFHPDRKHNIMSPWPNKSGAWEEVNLHMQQIILIVVSKQMT